jgi:hypothetical protein
MFDDALDGPKDNPSLWPLGGWVSLGRSGGWSSNLSLDNTTASAPHRNSVSLRAAGHHRVEVQATSTPESADELATSAFLHLRFPVDVVQ